LKALAVMVDGRMTHEELVVDDPAEIQASGGRGSAEPGAVDTDGRQTAVGSRLRAARRGRYSVEQLAARSGVSAGSISLIERGRGNPSLSTLIKLAHALDIPLESLFQPSPRPSSGVVRAGEGMRMLLGPSREQPLTYEVLTPNLRGRLTMIRTRIPPGASSGRHPLVHPGEEIIHVVEGSLQLRVADETYLITPGDTVTFDSGMPHGWQNAGGDHVTLLSAMSPPLF
jgi:transcriptional regulator with XRE-family HTH domain